MRVGGRCRSDVNEDEMDDTTHQTQTMQFACGACGKDFSGDLPVMCEIEVWAAAAQAVRCPTCGSSEIRIGRGRKDGETPGTAQEAPEDPAAGTDT